MVVSVRPCVRLHSVISVRPMLRRKHERGPPSHTNRLNPSHSEMRGAAEEALRNAFTECKTECRPDRKNRVRPPKKASQDRRRLFPRLVQEGLVSNSFFRRNHLVLSACALASAVFKQHMKRCARGKGLEGAPGGSLLANRRA